MSSSVTQRIRFALLPLAAVVAVACGSAASTSITETIPDATTDTAETTTSESSLAPAGARSFYTFDQSGGGLVRVDPDNGQVDEVLDLEGSVYAMDQAAGHLWLGTDTGSVLRVDPAAGSTIAEIAAPSSEGLFDLSVGSDAAWVLYGIPGAGTSLVRIDTAANTAGEPVAADEGLSFFDIESGDEGTWLVGSSPEMATTLYAVDPTTGELTDQNVQMVIDSIASGEGAVWLGGTIFPDGAVGVPGIGKFDPASGELATTEVPGEAGSIAVGSGGVWAVAGLGEDGTELYRIDPATGEVTATIPLGEADSGYVKVSTGAGAVWVTTAGGASYAVDPADNTVAGEADSMGTLGLFFPES
jgi:DNA-binding beta-propeller fold protein YncE